MKALESLRHKLNINAELSGQEKNTNKIINKFLEKTNPDVHLRNVGGYGIVAIYKGVEEGKNILLRADIDGLNIPRGSLSQQVDESTGQQVNGSTGQRVETQSLGQMPTANSQSPTANSQSSTANSQSSTANSQSPTANSQSSTANSQFSHRCGHDGHAAILCGLAMRYGKKRPERGSVILLFQPAEETGEGAQAVINDPLFRELRFDAAFALHNLPGYAKHQIVIKKDCFASASLGLKLIFDGKTSHASQPDKGNNPQKVVTTLLDAFQKKYENLKKDKHHTILTVTHVVIGEETFGVAPGHAEIWLTLRSRDDNALKNLTDSTIGLCEFVSKEFKLNFTHSIHEAFAATINSDREVDIVEAAAHELRLSVNKINDAFPWSEDFGRFGSLCSTCLFGLGCGFEHEPLHSPRYDFEDEIIDTGVDVFEKIVEIDF